MSGANVAYHLRPNKLVERQLFIEALRFVKEFCGLEKYVYISMGGRFLEDFKIIHRSLGIKKLISVEDDLTVYGRQLFNKPFSFIEVVNQNTSDLVTGFDSLAGKHEDHNFIIWLDYASPKERKVQLGEFEALISKLDTHDIIKITLNANLRHLEYKFNSFDTSGSRRKIKIQKEALGKLEKQLGDYMPDDYTYRDMTEKGFAEILADAVNLAALKGISGDSNKSIIPLAMFRYSDSSQMLTATAIILDKEEVAEFENAPNFLSWKFKPQTWTDVHRILVPDLSIKERFRLDELLFTKTAEKIHEELPFRFDEDEDISLDIFKAYQNHYRRYPNFARVTF